MCTKKSTLLDLVLGIVFLVSWASTSLSQSNENTSYDNDLDRFSQNVEEKLTKINAIINLYPVGDQKYDILVSWHVDPNVIRLLLNGDPDTQIKTLGTIVGMMMFSAAVVGEEATGANFQSRNIVFRFNGEKIAYIPVMRCRNLMRSIKYERTSSTVEEFLTYLVLYR